MPTSQDEVIKIKEIIDEYLSYDDAKAIAIRLHYEVGQTSGNDSLKISLSMLKKLYEGENNE
tara:strand:- start:12125 stop:12310 length:186 start_codon:yes stop_codon:yes gene_type:complete